MKTILIILLALLFIQCKGEPISSTQSGDFKIELLFEKDGCKVYRFVDGNRCIYWSNCTGNTEYTYTKHIGKTTSTHRIQTLNN